MAEPALARTQSPQPSAGPAEAIVGATGYIGGRLLAARLAQGRRVRALARDPSRLPHDERMDAVEIDLLGRGDIARALDGCETAYYLVHSMERASDTDFSSRDRRAAERFAAGARDAGVERIVYLGGMAPGGAPSPHLRSRLEVERILLDAVPGSTALRASIVIGARSTPFRLLVRLVERLRVIPLPPWHRFETQPIAERDVVRYLLETPATAAAAGRSIDIAGPDRVSYGRLIELIAESMGVGRMPLGVRVAAPPLTSAIVSAVTQLPVELVRPLMGSLLADVVPRDDDARRIYAVRPLRLERAIERALAEWERYEPLAAR